MKRKKHTTPSICQSIINFTTTTSLFFSKHSSHTFVVQKSTKIKNV